EEKTVEALRNFLSKGLPDFMVPARFVAMDKLPLSPSGKIDRKALPDPGEEFKTGKVFIAPNNEQEKHMIEIWAATLGIRPEVISMEDDFFALGGNSLKAVMLISKIHQRLEVQISIQMIFQNATPKSLIDHMHKIKFENYQFDAHLIPLQANGSRAPLFVVPGIEGKCFYLVEMAKALGNDQPVYGFQYMGLLDGEDPFDSIEQMAAFNISLIRKVQPQGPYQLAGHSMGGWIAVEIAKQLTEQGEKVAFLGLFDSYSPNVLREMNVHPVSSQNDDLRNLLMLLERLFAYKGTDFGYAELEENLLQMDHKNRIAHVREWIISNGLLPNTFTDKEIWQWAKLIGANSRISYEPSRINLQALLIKADITYRDHSNLSECLGWTKILDSDLEIRTSPGDHINMMSSQNAIDLAKILKENLQKSMSILEI
ncbi:thioesterase domain-containing protein, partial [Cecembia rubra]